MYSSVNILHLQINSELSQPNPKWNCFYISFLCIINITLLYTLHFRCILLLVYVYIVKDWWSIAVTLDSKDPLTLCSRKKRQNRLELWNRKFKSREKSKGRKKTDKIGKIGFDFLLDFLAKMPKCHKMPKKCQKMP